MQVRRIQKYMAFEYIIEIMYTCTVLSDRHLNNDCVPSKAIMYTTVLEKFQFCFK